MADKPSNFEMPMAAIPNKIEDQPMPARIILTMADVKSSGEAFLGLSGTLYRQNLIYAEPMELRRTDGAVELTVVFRDLGSFENWKENVEIRSYWLPKFDALLLERPKTIHEEGVVILVDNIRNCVCTHSDFYLLQGRTLPFADELICGNCLRLVPYSCIPLEIKIEDWQRNHGRIYSTWLESGLFEEEAFLELTNYTKGKLNLEGEEIRKALATYFGLPVYISYFADQPDDDHPCLICGDPGCNSGLKRPSRICKRCNTAFGFSAQ